MRPASPASVGFLDVRVDDGLLLQDGLHALAYLSSLMLLRKEDVVELGDVVRGGYVHLQDVVDVRGHGYAVPRIHVIRKVLGQQGVQRFLVGVGEVEVLDLMT